MPSPLAPGPVRVQSCVCCLLNLQIVLFEDLYVVDQLTLKKQKVPACDNAGLLTMGETSVTPVCRVH